MPWLRFVDNFDWRPTKKAVVAFLKDTTVFVTRGAAAEATSAGKAVIAQRPAKEDADAGR